MKPKRLFLIINPISGDGKKAGLDLKIKARLEQMGHTVETAMTQCAGDATRLAGEAVEAGYDGVLVCGGDGTVNETARAMCGTGVPMGIIPAGSGNGLARHIGIPIDVMRSLDVIAEDLIVDCDYCTANDVPFFCTFGLGYDAAVAHEFAASGKRGFATYLKCTIHQFFKYNPRPYTIEIDGERQPKDAFIVTCCNASQFGNNAFISPRASITDGLVDLIVVRKASRLRTLLVGVDLMIGNLHHNTQASIVRTRELTIHRPEPGEAHIDGEAVEMPTDITVRCMPGQLRMFITGRKKRFRPVISPIQYVFRDMGLKISRKFRKS